jgi:hypothetical protein
MDPQIVYRLGVALLKLEKGYPTLGKPDVAPLEREEVVGEGPVSPTLRFSDLLDGTGRLLDVVGARHCCLTSEVGFADWLFRLAMLLRLGPLVPDIVLDPPGARLHLFLRGGLLTVLGGLGQLVPDVVLRPPGARLLVTFGHTLCLPQLGDLICLHALLALGRLVGDLVTLFEGLEPCTLYTREVHKEVLTPIVWEDKAVALILTEPLNRSLGHTLSPPFFFWGSTATKNRP